MYHMDTKQGLNILSIIVWWQNFKAEHMYTRSAVYIFIYLWLIDFFFGHGPLRTFACYSSVNRQTVQTVENVVACVQHGGQALPPLLCLIPPHPPMCLSAFPQATVSGVFAIHMWCLWLSVNGVSNAYPRAVLCHDAAMGGAQSKEGKKEISGRVQHVAETTCTVREAWCECLSVFSSRELEWRAGDTHILWTVDREDSYHRKFPPVETSRLSELVGHQNNSWRPFRNSLVWHLCGVIASDLANVLQVLQFLYSPWIDSTLMWRGCRTYVAKRRLSTMTLSGTWWFFLR